MQWRATSFTPHRFFKWSCIRCCCCCLGCCLSIAHSVAKETGFFLTINLYYHHRQVEYSRYTCVRIHTHSVNSRSPLTWQDQPTSRNLRSLEEAVLWARREDEKEATAAEQLYWGLVLKNPNRNSEFFKTQRSIDKEVIKTMIFSAGENLCTRLIQPDIPVDGCA